MEEINGTASEDFFLKGFYVNLILNKFIFVTLLLVYLITMVGNLLIMIVIYNDYRLHSPMYFFLACLSFTDLFMVTFVVPKFLVTIVAEKIISKTGCLTQSYFYYFVTTADLLILTVMSIDRYVAICHPLRYSYIMRNTICIKLVIFCFITPFVCLLYPTAVIPNLPFCGHVVDHFFCESSALLKLVCVDISLIKLNTIFTSVLILIGCTIVITVSYICIVFTIIRMSSDTGRQKTFSTCLSHLIMLSLVFGSAIFILVRPPKEYSVEKDKIVNLVSTVIAPLLNPFIYSLRNQNVKTCIRDAIKCS